MGPVSHDPRPRRQRHRGPGDHDLSADPRAIVRLRWLTPDEGGRDAPPPGPRHVAEARLATPGLASEAFGVVLDLAAGGQLASLRLLAPEQAPSVGPRIRAGARLRLLEGERVVAEVEVQYVPDEELPAG